MSLDKELTEAVRRLSYCGTKALCRAGTDEHCVDVNQLNKGWIWLWKSESSVFWLFLEEDISEHQTNVSNIDEKLNE